MKFFIKPLPHLKKTKSVFFAKVRDVSLGLQPTRNYGMHALKYSTAHNISAAIKPS